MYEENIRKAGSMTASTRSPHIVTILILAHIHIWLKDLSCSEQISLQMTKRRKGPGNWWRRLTNDLRGQLPPEVI